MSETVEQAETDVQVPKIEKRVERWPNADIRHIQRAGKVFQSRGVSLVMACLGCQEYLRPDRVDAAGNAVVVCGCTERVWEDRR